MTMNKPHHCPKCGSKNVDYRYIIWDSNNNKRVVGKCCCHDCKTLFKEHYLTDYQGSEICEYETLDCPMSAPVSNSSSKKSKVTLKRVPHKHVYEYYRTCSAGMSPDAGMVWEEWRCNRSGCGDIIRRNERILEQEAWWNRD